MSSTWRTTLSSFAYKNVFRKTSTFTLLIGITAIFVDRGSDIASETIWRRVNQGRLFVDVKKNLQLE